MGDTICAIATPPGQGGLGVIRISGPSSYELVKTITGSTVEPRAAHLRSFRDGNGDLMDTGIAIFYQSPASYTGEDVLELQGHGSPAALQRTIDYLLSLGVRLAEPGEFTQRAFLNGKLDLTQAEAVADLISSESLEAAQAAVRSLSGEFAKNVNSIDEQILRLRVYIEGSLDFAEEEIDLLNADEQTQRLVGTSKDIDQLLEMIESGYQLQSGFDVVIAGKPNVGKSSLLNALLGEERAIVTPVAGTTRDTLEGVIHIDGFPIRMVDTAGLHEGAGEIEREGIRRAQKAIESADVVLWVEEDGAKPNPPDTLRSRGLVVFNKCDLTGNVPGSIGNSCVRVSALQKIGLDDLKKAIQQEVGFSSRQGLYAGRPRHIAALKSVKELVGGAILEMENRQDDLVAENLRQAHQMLGQIVGETTSDELLGEIFSTFCIGK